MFCLFFSSFMLYKNGVYTCNIPKEACIPPPSRMFIARIIMNKSNFKNEICLCRLACLKPEILLKQSWTPCSIHTLHTQSDSIHIHGHIRRQLTHIQSHIQIKYLHTVTHTESILTHSHIYIQHTYTYSLIQIANIHIVTHTDKILTQSHTYKLNTFTQSNRHMQHTYTQSHIQIQYLHIVTQMV